ncbi:MAG TPA: hypothetical protein VH207_02775 [Chthoniobacterales bacterium]|jgi:hypothetical protein|nr:hypothetical protein [Chthoniobacterales bacterium]
MTDEPVIRFDAPHRVLVLVLVGLFVVCVGLRLHGFSLPEWHEQLDGSPPNEVLLGQPRIIRMDDWAAALCTILAQRQARPAFPVWNKNIGLGANMVVNPIKTPVLHWVTIYRPHLWGYFFGRDFGLAWHWWTLLLGLFYSYFLFFRLVSGGRFFVAISGALLIACSPFFQFKSLEYAEIAIFAALLFVALSQILFTSSRRQQVVGGLLLAWSAGGLALNFYPASQISLGYLLIFITVGFLFRHRAVLREQDEWKHRIVCLAGGAGLAALAVAVFVVQGWPILQILNQTVFPGQRFVTGGDYPWWRIFANDFFLQFFLGDNLPGTNICEYGSFLFFFPVFAAWAVYQMWRERQVDFLILSLLLFCFALTTFAVAGFPAWLSAVTLMSKVPPNRSMVALGVANAALLCAMAASRQTKRRADSAPLVLVGCWIVFLFIMARSIAGNYGTLTVWQLAGPAVVLGFLAYGLLQERLKEGSLFLLALISIGASCWFNPLVRGGTAYLYRNPLATKMRALSAHDPGARWATFGTMFHPDYPRLLGLPAIDGTEPYPQFAFWARLDPEGRYFEEYNRYAHVWFTAAENGIEIKSTYLDQVRVSLAPNDPILDPFDVRLFLVVSPEDQIFDRLPQLAKVFTWGRMHIYRKRGAESP